MIALEPQNLYLGSPAPMQSVVNGARQMHVLGASVRCQGCMEGSAP